VVAANDAFRRSLIGRAEIDGRPCRDAPASAWPCSMDTPDGCPVARVFETGRLHKGILSRIDPEGRERTIEIHASPLRGPGGAIDLTVEVRRDISERRHLEASVPLRSAWPPGLLACRRTDQQPAQGHRDIRGWRSAGCREPGIAPQTLSLDEVWRSARNCSAPDHHHRLLKVARPPGAPAVWWTSTTCGGHLVWRDMRRAGITARLALWIPPLGVNPCWGGRHERHPDAIGRRGAH
jgi:hypothetical protein